MYIKRQSGILGENNRPGHSVFDSMMAYLWLSDRSFDLTFEAIELFECGSDVQLFLDGFSVFILGGESRNYKLQVLVY